MNQKYTVDIEIIGPGKVIVTCVGNKEELYSGAIQPEDITDIGYISITSLIDYGEFAFLMDMAVFVDIKLEGQFALLEAWTWQSSGS